MNKILEWTCVFLSPKKKISIGIILIIILLLLAFTKNISSNFIKPQEFEQESLFAIYINDEKTTQFPSQDEGYSFDEEKSFCNNGVSIDWSYLFWTANIEFQNYELQNKERTFCNLYFKTREEYTFDYTGSEQEFVALKDGYYQVELWGAGSWSPTYSDYRGGAYVSGKMRLQANQSFSVFVGGRGENALNATTGGIGGYNGGASAANSTWTMGGNDIGTGGGGATDIRISGGMWNNFESLKSRIMVAAGAGGSVGGLGSTGGGGLNGYNGNFGNGNADAGGYGMGASQTSGGSCFIKDSLAKGDNCTGIFGIANSIKYFSDDYVNTGGGGGGGYYGGGSSPTSKVGYDGGSAGSGSSFISGHNGCDAIKEESTESNIIHTGQPNHYSGYVFTETKMVDGNGYAWTDTKQNFEAMPNPIGGYYDLGVGHTGNGYARITYLGK